MANRFTTPCISVVAPFAVDRFINVNDRYQHVRVGFQECVPCGLAFPFWSRFDAMLSGDVGNGRVKNFVPKIGKGAGPTFAAKNRSASRLA
jgi:hypothetical protein